MPLPPTTKSRKDLRFRFFDGCGSFFGSRPSVALRLATEFDKEQSIMRVSSVLLLVVASWGVGSLIPTVSAFAPSRPALTARRHHNTALSAILPEHMDALSSAMDHIHHFDLAASTSWLADSAVADAAKEDEGLWKSYLNIFKVTLEFVHRQVDPPLRAMGITQTWGISIALFTAGTESRQRITVCRKVSLTTVAHSHLRFSITIYRRSFPVDSLVDSAVKICRVYESA